LAENQLRGFYSNSSYLTVCV